MCSARTHMHMYTHSLTHTQAVFKVDYDQGLTLTELGDGVSIDDVRAATGCPFKVSDDLQPMKQA